MKAKLSQQNLLKAIQVVQRSVSPRSTLPILNGILFETGDSKMVLSATDLEIAMRTEIPAKVNSPGKVVIPAKLISDVIRNLPERDLEIDASNKEEIRVVCEHSQFNLKTLTLEDFPKFPDSHPTKNWTLKQASFLEGIKQVVKAASRDETRPILTGVLLTINKGRLRMVATDSYRLALRDEKLNTETDDSLEVIIPSRSIEEVAKIIPLSTADIKIGLTQNQIMFNLGETVLISRLLEGEYPSYEQLLPKDHEVKLEVSRDNLLKAVRRASIIAQNTPLKLSLEEDQLKISAQTSGLGQAEEVLDVKKKGENFEIAFNPQYLMDGLSGITGDTVFLELTSPLKPGFLRGEEKNFRSLIMPVRL